eukprot:m.849542 g.849542  ORF g.849542 m.849542 type:complete len:924 (+) comp59574_c0_seq9:3143-5914(+)
MADTSELSALIDEIEVNPEALVAIVGHTKNKQSHSLLIQLGILHKLQQQLTEPDTDESSIVNSAICLWNLAADEANKNKIATEGLIEALVERFDTEQERAYSTPIAGALKNLAAGDVERKKGIILAGFLQKIVQLAANLPEMTDPLACQLAGVIANLAASGQENLEELKLQILEAGALGPVTSWLDALEYPTIVAAATAIKNITAFSDQAKEIVAADSSAMSNLVRLVGANDEAARAQASSALQNLANGSREVRNSLLKHGAIPYLVGLVSHATDNSRIPAITAIACLCAGDEAIKEALVNAEILPVVVALASDKVDEVRKQASSILHQLSEGSKSRQEAILKLNTIPLLAASLLSVSDKSHSLYTLAMLAAISDDVRKQIIKTNALSSSSTLLLEYMEKKDVQCILAASLFFVNMSNGPDVVRKEIAKTGVLTPMCSLLTAADAQVQLNACAVFCGMSHSENDVRSLITKVPDYRSLISLFAHPETKMRDYASNCLMNVAEVSEPVRSGLVAAGIIPATVTLLSDANKSCCSNACGIVRALAASEPDKRAAVFQANTIPLMLAAVTLGDDVFVKQCNTNVLAALRHFVCDANLKAHQILVDSQFLRIVSGIFATLEDESQLQVVLAVTEILSHLPSARQEFLGCGLLPVFVALLGSKSKNEQLCTALLTLFLSNSEADEAFSRQLIDAGILPLLLAFVPDQDANVTALRVQTIHIFCNLSLYPPLRSSIKEAGVVERLLKLRYANGAPREHVLGIQLMLGMISEAPQKKEGTAPKILISHCNDSLPLIQSLVTELAAAGYGVDGTFRADVQSISSALRRGAAVVVVHSAKYEASLSRRLELQSALDLALPMFFCMSGPSKPTGWLDVLIQNKGDSLVSLDPPLSSSHAGVQALVQRLGATGKTASGSGEPTPPPAGSCCIIS